MAYCVDHAYRMPYHGFRVEVLNDYAEMRDYWYNHGVRSLYAGVAVPSDLIPTEYEVQGKRVPKHGFITGPTGFLVDDRVKDIAERLEPGVHRFHPVNIRMKDGQPLARPQYLLNCCVRLNALDVENSDVEMAIPDPESPIGKRKFIPKPFPETPEEPWEYIERGSREGLAFHKDKIKPHAMWSEERLPMLFMSTEMVGGLRDAGVDGFDAVEVAET